MKRRLVLCTTAIVRGDYHHRSLGAFYQAYPTLASDFDVTHLINVDTPGSLADRYRSVDTVALLKRLTPHAVRLVIIENSGAASFLSAYKAIMHAIQTEELLSDDTTYWWFEDDWRPTRPIDLTALVDKVLFQNTSVSLTKGARLGSLRAGPIMSGTFFRNYFDLVNAGVANETCDPERQVMRWLSGKRRPNGREVIKRHYGDNNTIQIVCIDHGSWGRPVRHLDIEYYRSSGRYDDGLRFQFYVLRTDVGFRDMKLALVSDDGRTDTFARLSQADMKRMFDAENITHMVVIPSAFEDVGRAFNRRHGLKKWSTLNDGTTYV